MESIQAAEAAAKIQSALDLAIAGLLDPGDEVALVNFPRWGNVGDGAIWLGEVAAIRRAGARIRYRADSRLYRRGLVEDAIGRRGTILLHGGGNLGDVYPLQHRVRKRILRDFPGARIVQLPQTIWYRRPERARRFGDACRAHPGFTLMVREAPSADVAREQLGIDPVLAPDCAFGLGPLGVAAAPDRDVLWLLRDDREGTAAVPADLAPDARDWPDKFGRGESGGARLRTLLALDAVLRVPLERNLRGSGASAALAPRTYDAIARRRLVLALATISRGRVVVTDRLHGQILCTLAGIPHVALDNASGKSRGTYETWTSMAPGTRLAADADEAAAMAGALLAGASGERPHVPA